ncbi:unnamed protein product [Cuscuta epithymum]|uniref:FAS1 domain-containing protein n=1 Tax=Cuscuta epithymum TaxID=186058 RepID=A0AAV0FTB2_9ASTE|nr:unnamed protein product [Cuscuta epithymum]
MRRLWAAMICGVSVWWLIPGATTAAGHNITSILENKPELSSFSSYLTETNLTAEINRREGITVLAVDNAAMEALAGGGNRTLESIKDVLLLHVLVDYIDGADNETGRGAVAVPTLCQGTSTNLGSDGFVNVVRAPQAGGGESVAFLPVNVVNPTSLEPLPAFVESVEKVPNSISVIQISHFLTLPHK